MSHDTNTTPTRRTCSTCKHEGPGHTMTDACWPCTAPRNSDFAALPNWEPKSTGTTVAQPLPAQIEALIAQRLAPDGECNASDVRALVADVLRLAAAPRVQPKMPDGWIVRFFRVPGELTPWMNLDSVNTHASRLTHAALWMTPDQRQQMEVAPIYIGAAIRTISRDTADALRAAEKEFPRGGRGLMDAMSRVMLAAAPAGEQQSAACGCSAGEQAVRRGSWEHPQCARAAGGA